VPKNRSDSTDDGVSQLMMMLDLREVHFGDALGGIAGNHRKLMAKTRAA
jgi:hypothetical protein